jgi:glycosyltransferase involved in cell wall biosynthesis
VTGSADDVTVRWLVLAEEEFVPTDSGGRVESLNLLRSAAAAGVRLHVVVPGLTAASAPAHRAALPEAVVEGVPRRTGARAQLSVLPYVFVSRPMAPGLVERLRSVHDKNPFDGVVSISFRVAHLGETLANALDTPLLVRPHNVESEYFSQLARSLGLLRSLPYRVEAWRLRRAERRLHRSNRITVFADIAEVDAARRRDMTAIPVMHVPPFLPPGTVPHWGAAQSRNPASRRVLFVGSLDNGNNVDGIRWFAERCWPALRVQVPGSALHVVGRRAPLDLVDHLRRAGAEVTVDAPAVAPLLAAGDVFINPVRKGAGVNIKMIDAMAAGLPVVSTTVGARGMHWRPGEHLVVADDPGAFVAAVADLLTNSAARARLAAAGRSFVGAELDGVASMKRLVAVLQAEPAGTRAPSS